MILIASAYGARCRHPADIYDQVKHDAVHNLSLELEAIPELYRLSKAFGG